MARILGIAIHLPERVETSEDLHQQYPNWNVAKLCAKTGIYSRRIAAPGETASDLAYKAACKLLDRGDVDRDEIDYLLYCTQGPDHFLPTTACVLQDRLGLGNHVGALDYNLGCSGYVYGLQLAKCLIAGGMARKVLLLTADTYTKYIHPCDRTLRLLFGDGAAATVVGSSDDSPEGLQEFLVGTDGKGAKNLIVPSGGFRLPRSPETAQERMDDNGCVRSLDNMYMNGRAVFSFAIAVVPRLVADLLAKARLKVDDVDWFVYHQANEFMLRNLAESSGVPPEKLVLALEDVGNTVSASIPIAIHRHVEAGRIREGHRLMLIGFGVGYSYGACLVTWTGANGHLP